jgi:hypothetical protein
MIPRITINNRWIPKDNWREYMNHNTDKTHPQLWDKTCEVEVLTVHFQKNTMRIRFAGRHEGMMASQDIPANEFFEQIALVAK